MKTPSFTTAEGQQAIARGLFQRRHLTDRDVVILTQVWPGLARLVADERTRGSQGHSSPASARPSSSSQVRA